VGKGFGEALLLDSPRKLPTCIGSAYSKLVYEVIEKVEERLEQATSSTSEFKSSVRKVIQSAYRLLHTIEMCQSMRSNLWVDGSKREVLMTVYMKLSNLLSSSMQEIQHSKLEDCVAAAHESTLASERPCVRENLWAGEETLAMEEVFEWHSKLEDCVAAVHESTSVLERPCVREDAWAGEEALAMEELFEWFADSLAASGPVASRPDDVFIRTVTTDSFLHECWEQRSKRHPATSSPHNSEDDCTRSPSLSLGSVSTAGSLGSISRMSRDSSSAPSPVFFEQEKVETSFSFGAGVRRFLSS